jgi:hypothetical protein
LPFILQELQIPGDLVVAVGAGLLS